MNLLRHALFVVGLLAFPGARPAQSDPPASAKSDFHGDPLPEFARARFGTLRFRHACPVQAVRFLPDGQTLLSLDSAQTFRMWNRQTGQERPLELGNSGLESPWRLSPNGQLLIVTAPDGSLSLRSLDSGKEIHQLEKIDAAITEPVFCHDGKTIIAPVAGAKGETIIHFWETTTGKVVRRLELPSLKEVGARFTAGRAFLSPDAKILAVFGTDGKGNELLRLFDAASGKEMEQEDKPLQNDDFVAFSPDGKLVATMGYRVMQEMNNGVPTRRETAFRLVIRETATGKVVHDLGEFPNNGNGRAANDLLFSPDNKTLGVKLGQEYLVRCWDTATGKERPFPEVGQGGATSFRFSPDSSIAAVGTLEGTLYLCDTITGKALHKLDRYQPQNDRGRPFTGTSIAFSLDGKIVAAAGADNLIRTWSVAEGKELRPVASGHEGEVVSVAVSPDGKTLLSAGTDDAAILWDVGTGKELHRLALSSSREPAMGNLPLFAPRSAVFSPDGKTVATSGNDSVIQLWAVRTGKEVGRLTGHDCQVTALAFGMRTLLASASAEGRVILWETSTGKNLHQLAGPAAVDPDDTPPLTLRPLAVSSDGRLLATADVTENGLSRLSIWEVGTGKLRRQIEIAFVQMARLGGGNPFGLGIPSDGSDFGIVSLAFSPDGKTIAGNLGGSIYLWDLATGKELRQFGSVQPRAWRIVRFMPDGKVLAAAGPDGSVRFWETATGTVLCDLYGHRGGVSSLAVMPDGRTLITGGRDTTVMLWDVEAALHAAKPQMEKQTPERTIELWKQLGSDNGEQAEAAVQRLTALGGPAVEILGARLKPVSAVDEKRIRRLVADLEHNGFETRKEAADELEKLAELAEPILRKRLNENPSLDLRTRLEGLLNKAVDLASTSAQMQTYRAVETLERIGSSEAKEILRRLAEGAPAARLTQDAQGALRRLAN